MRTVHLICKEVSVEAFEQMESPGLIVDLTVSQCSQQFPVASANGSDRDIEIVPAEWQRTEQVEVLLKDWMDWLAEMARCPVDGQCLVDAMKIDERLSLWWVSGFTMKHFLRSPLLAWTLFAGHLSHCEKLAARIAQPGQRIILWADDHELLRKWGRALSTMFPHCDVQSSFEEERAGGLTRVKQRADSVRARAKDAARVVRNVIVGQAQELDALRRGASCGPDDDTVAICVFPTTWVSREGEAPANRYWSDIPQQIAERVGRPTIVPCSPGPVSRDFHEAASRGAEYVDWSRAPTPVLGTTVRIPRILARMRRRCHAILDGLSERGVTRYGNLEVTEMLRWYLDNITGNGGFELLHLYFSLRNYFDGSRPRLVLFRNEFYPTGRIVRAALPSGVPAFGIQHGIILPEHTVYSFSSSWLGPNPGGDSTWEYVPSPSRFLAYGELVRELMGRFDYPRERIEPIGSPRHDEFFSLAASAPKRTRGQDDEFLLLIPGSTVALTRRWIDLAVQAVAHSSVPIRLLIKPHWQYPMLKELEALRKRHSFVDVVPAEGQLQEWYPKIDAILVETSTTGLEAAIFGVPVISLLRSDRTELFPYVKEGAAIGVTNPTELADAIDTCACPDYREQWEAKRVAFLRRVISPELGNSTKRLLEFIEAQANSSGAPE